MTARPEGLSVLVAGGAGYIGSVTTAVLIGEGHRVTVLDNLSTGYRDAVNPAARFVEGDIADRDAVREACGDGIDVAMHFSAFIEVGESVKAPAKYYNNNVVRTIALLDALRESGVHRLVFSSTAAVYGIPSSSPLTENAPLAPVNPYGWSKRMVEAILRDYDRAYGFRSVSLRYFNAGGAHGGFGENHRPETHLIPNILAAAGRDEPVGIFGGDYDTRDGTCIRDYIHVRDIAEAHVLAASRLMNGGGTDSFNLGTGTGYTVLEVIRAVERVTGMPVRYEMKPRRAGDSPELVASPRRARDVLGWTGELASLDDIIGSAHEWRRRFPNGYER